MKYQTYTKYKSSGIKWIGDVPNDWGINRFKFFYSSNMGQTIIAIDLVDDGKYPVVSATEKDKYFGKIDNPNFILKKGDLIIPARGNSIGFVKKVHEKCVSTQTTIYCKKNGLKIDTNFIHYYLLNCKKYIFPFTATAIPQITVDEVKENPVIVPTENDQQKIVNFLDKKTKQIDDLIKKDKQLIELLKEKRIALINKAVTKGLDDKARLVDSGVDWIGEIPEGWEIHRLKYKVDINNNNLGDNTKPDLEIVYLDISNVDSNGNLLNFENYIYEDAPSRAKRLPETGDSVVSTVRTYLRAIAYLKEIPKNLVVSTGFAVLHPKDIDSKYLYYCVSSEKFVQNVIANSKGVAYPAINSSELGDLFIVCPKIEFQKDIVEYIKKSLKKNNEVTRVTKKRIRFLEEYKKSLIYNAVTGKIKV